MFDFFILHLKCLRYNSMCSPWLLLVLCYLRRIQRENPIHFLNRTAVIRPPQEFFNFQFEVSNFSTLFMSENLTKRNSFWPSIKINRYKTGIINDPLGQTYSLASSEHCFLLFCFTRFESMVGRTDVQKNQLKTARVDQFVRMHDQLGKILIALMLTFGQASKSYLWTIQPCTLISKRISIH